MDTQESLRQIDNLRLRFQMNNRLRLECLAAVSRIFREHGESVSDELLSSLVFAVPDELPGERPPYLESKQPGTSPPGKPPATTPPPGKPPASQPPATPPPGKPPAGYPPSQPPGAPPAGVPPPGGPPGQPKPGQPPPAQPAPGSPPPRPKSENGRKRVEGEKVARTKKERAS
jgi:hypothetical protein